MGGRCKCNGHAASCTARPARPSRHASVRRRDGGSVTGAARGGGLEWGGLSTTERLTLTCDCRHNTEGVDCERCRPFYHDRPWARATANNAQPCVGTSKPIIISYHHHFHNYCPFVIYHNVAAWCIAHNPLDTFPRSSFPVDGEVANLCVAGCGDLLATRKTSLTCQDSLPCC